MTFTDRMRALLSSQIIRFGAVGVAGFFAMRRAVAAEALHIELSIPEPG